MHSLSHPAANEARGVSETTIVIVSADAAEGARLRALLPPGVAVHLAETEGEAIGMLRGATGREAPLAAEVAPGVLLQPDGVLVALDAVQLTPLEHSLLRCLLSTPGFVWSLLALSQQVWGTSFVGDGSQVRAVIKRLRRKLVIAGTDLRIDCIRGRGFRIAVTDSGQPPRQGGSRDHVRPLEASIECPRTAPVVP